MSDYGELLNDFYELKKKYDKNYDRMKKKIQNNDELSREQKREKIKSLRPKCIKCKKPVGTIFEIKHDSLRAMCGANNPQMANEGYKPCSLNVNIKKPIIINLETGIKEVRAKRDQLLEQITLNKVHLLYEPREKQIELVEQIEQMKLAYREQSDLLELYIKKHLEIAANEEEAESLFLKSHAIGGEIMKLIKDKKTKDAVELYIEAYLPTVSLEMEKKYKHIYIETDGKDMHYLKEISPDNSLDVLEISKEELHSKKKNSDDNNNNNDRNNNDRNNNDRINNNNSNNNSESMNAMPRFLV